MHYGFDLIKCLCSEKKKRVRNSGPHISGVQKLASRFLPVGSTSTRQEPKFFRFFSNALCFLNLLPLMVFLWYLSDMTITSINV